MKQMCHVKSKNRAENSGGFFTCVREEKFVGPRADRESIAQENARGKRAARPAHHVILNEAKRCAARREGPRATKDVALRRRAAS
jgi:hypothetical protein